MKVPGAVVWEVVMVLSISESKGKKKAALKLDHLG